MRHGLYEDDDEYRSIPSELLDLFHSKPMAKPSLYEYEMEVIKEARNIVEFVEKKSAEKKATEKKIFCLHEKKRPLDFAIGKYFSIFAPLYQKGGGINAQAHERGPSSEKH